VSADARPPLEILDWLDTPLGPLCLRRRELLGRPGTVVTEVLLAGEMLMSSLYTASEEALATRALALHGGAPPPEGPGLAVLVGGLGLGSTAAAALADPRVARVRVLDALPAVIGWLRQGLTPLGPRLAADARLEVVEGDVYAELLGPPEAAWDLILIDVDHSPSEPLGPASAAFYEPAGLRRAAAHLAPGGVLAVWSAGSDDPFAAALAEVFPESTQASIAWTNDLLDAPLEVEDIIFLARVP
jgi:spermidine synthase